MLQWRRKTGNGWVSIGARLEGRVEGEMAVSVVDGTRPWLRIMFSLGRQVPCQAHRQTQRNNVNSVWTPNTLFSFGQKVL